MASEYQHTVPAESIVHRMSESGFRMGLVDTARTSDFEPWARAYNRGFHKPDLDVNAMVDVIAGKRDRRVTGVWESESPVTVEPVGTASSWPVELTVSTGRSVIAWAVSSITVSPTHRRKGIARALLEAELAAAAELGLPLAVLTVSESTIYGRFGFAPAAFVSNLTIENRRAGWVGPVPEGRVRFVSGTEARDVFPALHDRERVNVPGQISVWDRLWDQLVELDSGNIEKARSLRAVQYEDSTGTVQGLVLYRVSGGDGDYTKHVLEMEYLVAATSDAYAALWHYILDVDLVSQVKASLRSVDEPLRWQLVDQRALTERREDHLWARILDVPAALEARDYSADSTIGFDVSDVQGYATGHFVLTVSDGKGSVERVDGAFAEGVPVLSLSVNELSAMYLGGVSAATLESAGRVVASTAVVASEVDAVFRAPVAPWLDVWF